MNRSAQTPYDLSIVITTRNDDHGDQPLVRLQAMVDNLAWHARRLSARWELILVEWNPPADRQTLSKVLTLPDAHQPLRVRIIQVPAACHQRWAHADKLPLFQLIAKNVGGRRALGKFLLFTNMDILLSESLARWLASPGPQKGKVYRIDRSDCDRDAPIAHGPEEVLKWAASHRIRHNGLIGTYPVRPDGGRDEPEIVKCAGVQLGKGWSAYHDRPTPHLLASPLVRLEVEGATLAGGIALILAPGPGVNDRPVSLELTIHHPKKGCIFSAQTESGLGKNLLKIRIGEEKGACEVRIATRGLPAAPTRLQVHPWRLFAIEPLALEEIPLPSIQIQAVAWNDPRAKEDDIVEGDGVSLLGDWHPAEPAGSGRVSRWAGESPVLELACPAGSRGGWLTLVAHPGPGVGAKPFWLRVVDENDRCLRRAGVVGWRAIHIPVGARGRDWVRLRLMAAPRGYREGQDAGDPRVLNFAVSKIRWAPSKRGPGLLPRGTKSDFVAGIKTLIAWAMGKFQRKDLPAASAETLPMVHMNNCGDFTLIDRESFLESGGHSEEAVFSLNLDTLFLYRLVAMGLKEEILEPPLEIFHIEHGHASGATPEGMEELIRRVKERGIPVIGLDEVFDRARAQRADPKAAAATSASWGLVEETLPEESFGGGVAR